MLEFHCFDMVGFVIRKASDPQKAAQIVPKGSIWGNQ